MLMMMDDGMRGHEAGLQAGRAIVWATRMQ